MAKKDKKPPKSDLHIRLARLMAGESLKGFEEFKENFYRVTNEGKHIILKQVDDTGLVKISHKDEMIESIMQHCIDRPSFAVDSRKDATDVFDWWIAVSSSVEMPPPFRWLDEYGMTFSRLPWPNGVIGKYPTWQALGMRMSNFEAFKCFIGSLFDPTASHQQYVWCYGGGGNGKSAIDRVLNGIFGPAYRAAFPPDGRVGFWLRSLIGKKLVVFPDCNAKSFPASGLFKSLVANDAVETEEKGGNTISMRLGCRFIFMSNERPNISSENADTRRVIFCDLGKPHKDEIRADFEQNLWDEAGAFITHSAALWKLHMESGSNSIPTITDGIQSIIEDNEMHHERVLHLCFEIGDTTKEQGIAPVTLQHILENFYKSRHDQAEFRKWLEVQYGIKKIQISAGEYKGNRIYPGLFQKPADRLAEVYEQLGASGRTALRSIKKDNDY